MLNKRYFEKKRNSYSVEATETDAAEEQASTTTVKVVDPGLNDSRDGTPVESTEHTEREHIPPVTQGPTTDMYVTLLLAVLGYLRQM